MRRPAMLMLAAVLMAGSAARAVQPDEVLADPALEARARSLSVELRCMVCQNQSIDDSDAPLARDIRLLVREHLRAGEGEPVIRRFLVARYGDFILLRPPFEVQTLLLWLTPALAFGLGGFAVWRASRRTPGSERPPPLDDAERARLDRLLATDE